MARIARKAKPNVPRYGARSRSSRKATRTGTKDAALARLYAKALTGDKKAQTKLRELNREQESLEFEERKKHLLKRVPRLARLEAFALVGQSSFDVLCREILAEIDRAMQEGYAAAPGGNSDSPSFRSVELGPSVRYVAVPVQHGYGGYADR